MKIGLVYTSITPELKSTVEQEIRKQIGEEAELLSYQDPSILAEVRDAGFVPAKTACRLYAMYLKAIQDGADAILNICSSVGEAADYVKPMGRYLGIPIVRIDEGMCRAAVRKGKRIAVLATLQTTLEPTRNTILRVAREMGRQVELVDALVEAFDLNQEEFKRALIHKAKEVSDQADVILLSQGSMAYCEELIEEQTQKVTVSSPRYGVKELKEALITKGVLQEEKLC